MIGQTISHYRILKKLGEGGMGKVYLADDISLERKVALKFLPREMTADQDANRRFKREAYAIARLNHPNIITIHEIDELQGRNYIVMEYIPGGTLQEKMTVLKEQDDDLQKLRDILVIALQMGRGLQKAHEAGIIHRDIKPANILLDTDGQVKIMDFGLARLTGATSKLTRDGSTAGTAQYMAPEQITAGEIDQRSDIWSFGVVLYEMICGKPPFKEEFLQALFYSILNDSPPPLADLFPDLPADLEKIVYRCLAKEAEERYQTMAEVLADLKSVKSELTKEIPPVKKAGRFSIFLKRRKKFILPAIILVLGIMFTLIPNPGRDVLKNLLLNPKLPARKYLAVLPLVNSGNNLLNKVYTDGTTARIITKLTSLEQLQKRMWVVPSTELKANNINSVKKAGESFCVTLVLTGTVQLDKDEITYELNLSDAKTGKKLRTRILSYHNTNLNGLQDGILMELTEMLDIKWESAVEKILTAGGTSLPGAYLFYLQGMGFLSKENNKDNISKAMEMFNQAIELDDSYDEAFASLGNACLFMYRLTKEKNWLEDTESSCNRALKINKGLYPAHITLGYINQETGKYKNAVKDFQNALDINPECFQAALEIAGTYYFKLKEKNKAEEAFKNAIALRDEYWKGYKHLAYIYMLTNRYPEAEDKLRKVIDLNPADLWAYTVLIGIYNKRTDEISSRKAGEIFERSKKFGADGDIYSNMGTNLFFQKQYAESRDMYLKAMELGRDKSFDFVLWGNLADSYQLIGKNKEKAQNAYQEAVKLVQKKLMEKLDDAPMHASLALYLSKLGKFEQAILEINKALKLDPQSSEVLQNSVVVFEVSGKRSRALIYLAEIIKRLGALGELTRNPFLAEFRQDPEYIKLIKPESSREKKE